LFTPQNPPFFVKTGSDAWRRSDLRHLVVEILGDKALVKTDWRYRQWMMFAIWVVLIG
jgi:hypothetical protein